MGIMAPPLYGKSKFYQKKKDKAMKKIAKYQAIVNECNRIIALENVKAKS